MWDNKNIVICDIECYSNYFLIMFKRLKDGRVKYFEKYNDSRIDVNGIISILSKHTIITFNGNKYDSLIIDSILSGFSNKSLHIITNYIIKENAQPWEVRKRYNIQQFNFDHIDIIEVAPLKASLKIYAGRLNTPTMKDLPFPPETVILDSHLEEMRFYCNNDLDETELIYKQISPEIKLRCDMSTDYSIDLRSKSDAQIAEYVIKGELQTISGAEPKRPKIPVGTKFRYKAPLNLNFKSELMKGIFDEFKNNDFIVGKSGHVDLPAVLKGRKFKIGNTTYKIGIGGLHSCEKSTRVEADGGILRDYDVASYYPRIILNNSLYPKHLGRLFLKIYEDIVNRRLKAKKAGDKVTNESLKITINGSFGKFGSKWSCLYSPDLMMQVTVTGQLSLLMLIESLELNGIRVVSANTDGIVTKMEKHQESLAESIVQDWEFETDYEMESTDYISLNSRDVNNYIAVKESGVKGKGAYANQREHYYRLRSNPVNYICIEAVKKFLEHGTDIEETIRTCNDITKFLTIRTVNGGAVKESTLIGKAIRWYYGAYELDAIYYSTNGNKVPKSDGGVPLMVLPDTMVDDIDYPWYITESYRILKDIGFTL